ncbi:MAG: hypothetical protein QM662_13040, partial [Gordonia sp. (in: high G+C Gram-positive bacteria)]
MARVPRLTGPDEGFLLAEEKLGFRSPIQYCWVLDADPGIERIERVAAALGTGLLHRAIAPRRVPIARRRWVRSSVTPMVIQTARIDDDAISGWAEQQLRGADLRPIVGLGWRVVTTTTTRDRRVVTLLVSHLITDGEALTRALLAAADSVPTPLPGAETTRGARALRADLRDAAGQLRSAGRSVRSAL